MPETDFIDEIAPEPDVKELEAETPPPVEEAPPPVDPPVEKKTDEEKLPDEEKTSVPLPALQEERTRRQDLQQQLTESNERVGKIEALFERFRAEQVPPEKQIPSYEDDPEANLLGTLEETQTRLRELEQDKQQRTERDSQLDEGRVFIDRYAQSVNVFAEKNPDFHDAYKFGTAAVIEDLKARGYDDPVERENVLKYEEGMMIGRAMKAGKDPAEVIYNYARSRGYAKKAADEEEDTLARLVKGAEAAETLSGAGGETKGAMTLSRLSDLADEDPEEFDKQWDIMRRKGLLG